MNFLVSIQNTVKLAKRLHRVTGVGNIMLWDVFLLQQGDNGKMDGPQKRNGGQRFCFQLESNSKHKTGATVECFKSKLINVLECPS